MTLVQANTIKKLQAQIVTLNATITSQTDQISHLTAENAALTAQVADLNSQIAALNVEIANLKAHPPAGKTLIGTSTGQHTWATFTQKCGRELDVRRSYDTQPTTFMTTSGGKSDIGNCVSWWSTKFDNASAFNTLCTVPPSHRMIWTDHHEPFPEVTFVNYIANQKIHRKDVDAANAFRKSAANGGTYYPIKFVGIVMAQDIPNFESFYPGDGIWDAAGFDGYNWSVPIKRQPADIYGPAVAAAARHGLRVCYGETGSPAANPTVGNNDGSRVGTNGATLDPHRVQWISDAVSYARANNFLALCYWDNGFTGHPQFTLMSDQEFQALGG